MTDDQVQTQKKKRKVRLFPACSLNEALVVGEAIQKYAAGQKVRRLTLFDSLNKSPDSGPSRQLITNSSKYGITKGGYQAEFLELTKLGKAATDPDLSSKERLKARIKIGIEKVKPFNLLFHV